MLSAFVEILLVTVGNGDDLLATSSASLIGAVLMVISALALSYYSVWSIELTETHGAVIVAAWSTFFGFLTFLPLAGWEIWQISPQITVEVMGQRVISGW